MTPRFTLSAFVALATMLPVFAPGQFDERRYALWASNSTSLSISEIDPATGEEITNFVPNFTDAESHLTIDALDYDLELRRVMAIVTVDRVPQEQLLYRIDADSLDATFIAALGRNDYSDITVNGSSLDLYLIREDDDNTDETAIDVVPFGETTVTERFFPVRRSIPGEALGYDDFSGLIYRFAGEQDSTGFKRTVKGSVTSAILEAYDVDTDELVPGGLLSGNFSGPHTMDQNPEGSLFYTVTNDNGMYTLDIETGEMVRMFNMPIPTAGVAFIQVTGTSFACPSITNPPVVDDDNIDGTVGNGNSQVDPGEVVELYFTLDNTGSTALTNVSATLSLPAPGDPNVLVLQEIGTYGDIAASSSATLSDPYVVQVSLSKSCEAIPVTLNISSDEGSCIVNTTIPMGTGRIIPQELTYFSDQFEGPQTWSLQGNWQYANDSQCPQDAFGVDGYRSPSVALAFTDTSDCDVSTGVSGMISAAELPNPIALPSGGGNIFISWFNIAELDLGDRRRVEVSTNDGASWSTVFSSNSNATSWIQQSADLSPYAGQTVRLRFAWESGVSTSPHFGWFIDDVEVGRTGFVNECNPYISVTPSVTPTVTPFPNECLTFEPLKDVNYRISQDCFLKGTAAVPTTGDIFPGDTVCFDPILGVPEDSMLTEPIFVTLVSTDPNVDVVSSTAEFAYDANGVLRGTSSFAFAVDSGTPCEMLDFVFQISSEDGNCTVPFSIPMGTNNAEPTVLFEEPFSSPPVTTGTWSTSGLWHIAENSTCPVPPNAEGWTSASGALAFSDESTCDLSNANFGSTSYASYSDAVSLPFNEKEIVATWEEAVSLGESSGETDATRRFQVSTDGGEVWYTVYSDRLSASEEFQTRTVRLTGYAGDTIRFRFAITPGVGTTDGFGWYIDDFKLVEIGSDPVCTVSPTPTVTTAVPTTVPPTTTIPATTVATTIPPTTVPPTTVPTVVVTTTTVPTTALPTTTIPPTTNIPTTMIPTATALPTFTSGPTATAPSPTVAFTTMVPTTLTPSPSPTASPSTVPTTTMAPQPPPAFKPLPGENYSIEEDCFGGVRGITSNGDGNIDPGETICFYPSLENPSGIPYPTPIQVTMITEDFDINIIDDTVGYGNNLDGKTIEPFDPFIFELDPEAACEALEFALLVSYPGGSTTIDFSLPIGENGATPVVAFTESFDNDDDDVKLISGINLEGAWRIAEDSNCPTDFNEHGWTSGNRALALNDEETCSYGFANFEQFEYATFLTPIAVPTGYEDTLLVWQEAVNLASVEGTPGGHRVIEVSTNLGDTWTRVFDEGLGSPYWTERKVRLDDYAGQSIIFRYGFLANFAGTNDWGWYIDDVTVLASDYEPICDGTLFTPTITPTSTPTITATATSTPTPSPTLDPAVCATGTPYTPQVDVTATLSPTPSPDLPPAGPGVLSVTADGDSINVAHRGEFTDANKRHALAVWYRRLNRQQDQWVYLGFAEYLPGETSIEVPWAPLDQSRYLLASRVWVDGDGWYLDPVYGEFTDLGPGVYPEIGSISYDDSTKEIVIDFSRPGTLTSNIAYWTRRIIPSGPFVDTGVREGLLGVLGEDIPGQPIPAGEWDYVLMPYDYLTTQMRIPFDHGEDTYELASAVYINGLGFLLPHTFNFAPSNTETYPRLAGFRIEAPEARLTTILNPVGNLDCQIGLWFRELDPETCEPLCEWNFLGYQPYDTLSREDPFEWFAPNLENGAWEASARLYLDVPGFSGFFTKYWFAKSSCGENDVKSLSVSEEEYSHDLPFDPIEQSFQEPNFSVTPNIR